MKFITTLLMTLSMASCSMLGAHDHSCCHGQGEKVCHEGACEKDGSCCENKCGNCNGEKDACKTGECSHHNEKTA